MEKGDGPFWKPAFSSSMLIVMICHESGVYFLESLHHFLCLIAMLPEGK